MQIFKYRGFDKVLGFWCYGFPVPDKNIKDRWYIYFNHNEFVIIDDHNTITADTTHRDIKGNPIFHKDIICAKNNTGNWFGVVEFYAGHFWILEISGEDSGECKQWSVSIDCEVIGNIFENENLLFS